MKKPPLVFTVFILAASLMFGCTTPATSPDTTSQPSNESTVSTTRTITDMTGNTVTIPTTVMSIGTSWSGFINTICVAGGAEYITETPLALKNYPWAMKIFPNLADTDVVFSDGANIEQLAADDPDVLFLRKQDDVDKIADLGIPIVMVEYQNNSIYDMVAAVKLVGEVLGGDYETQAQKYSDFVDKNVSAIRAVTDNIADSDKPTVLALSVKNGKYNTWGKNIIQNEEIQIAGGINAAANDIDGSKEVSAEQINLWDPDYLFLVGSVKDKESFMSDPSFSSMKAIKSGNVSIVPKGVFVWSNLGSETALYEVWMAQTLYPEKLANLDINGQTKEFYKTFFNYDLSDDELSRIMNAEDPA